jgi:hypothetical protein
MDHFEVAPVSRLAVDVYTAAYHVRGVTASRFARVADLLNLLSSTHLVVEEATIVDLVEPGRETRFPVVYVSLAEILVLAADHQPGSRPEMRIPKTAARAEVAVAPFRLTGEIHIPVGGSPIEGFLNAGDRFLPMTDVAIRCALAPGLDRKVAAAAVQRDRAHLVMLAEDERAEQRLDGEVDERIARDLRGARDLVR